MFRFQNSQQGKNQEMIVSELSSKIWFSGFQLNSTMNFNKKLHPTLSSKENKIDKRY